MCLLVIDMQNVYLQEDPIDKKVIDNACMYINYVSNMLRAKDHIVVHIRDIEGLQADNKEMYETIPEIHIDEKDLKMTKVYSNSFWKTDLEEILRSHQVELVIVAGFAAEHCVLFTYNGANERGFKPVILQNGIVSSKSDVIASTYRDRKLISYPVIQHMTS